MDPSDAARRLYRAGDFSAALRTLGEPSAAWAPESHALRAELLERTGNHTAARSSAIRLLNDKKLDRKLRSLCELVLARVDLDRGDRQVAMVRLQKALTLANEASAPAISFRAQLALWQELSRGSGSDSATAVLAEVRASAVRLGRADLTSTLHLAVAEIELQRGAFNNAESHRRIADGILRVHPSKALECWADNLRLAEAVIFADVAGGMAHGTRALEAAEQCGVAALIRAALGNLGNICFLDGRFSDAKAYLDRALRALPTIGESRSGVRETLARIHLAEGNLKGCEQLLDEIEDSIVDVADRSLYVFRHSLLTRLRFLVQAGRYSEALSSADLLLELARKARDQFLEIVGRLAKSEVLQDVGRLDESLALARSVVAELHRYPPELQAKYEVTLGSALARIGLTSLGRAHCARAGRVYDAARNIPAVIELQNAWQRAESAAPPEITPLDLTAEQLLGQQTVQTVAATLLHAGRTSMIAGEVMECLLLIGAAKTATVSPSDRTPSVSDGQVVFRIASRADTVDLQFTPRQDIESRATIDAFRVILSAVAEIERARADREEQSRLWPPEELTLDGQAVAGGRMRELMSFARKIATANVSVLITGESGTGKEILARALHAYSDRAQQPLIPLNCAAVPRDMLESQLFGHRRGAFTGADRDHPGLIRAAEGGTILLDEIGEMNADLQPKLLRFLESGEILPVGESQPISVDVRVIAATNTNLEQLVKEGRFREDLFYRLNVIRLKIPPLRERRDEIPALVDHFLTKFSRDFRKDELRVTEETMEHLLLYRWPGNVRQLQNELRRVAAIADAGSLLTPDLLSEEVVADHVQRVPAPGRDEVNVPLEARLMPTLRRIEREMIQLALRRNQGKVDLAARSLGISRKGLYLKRQRLGL